MLHSIFFVIAWVFLVFGLVGIFRFKNFFSRALICSKIDTVAFFTIMVGVVFLKGVDLISLKVLVVALFFMFTNPVSTHLIVRSAHRDGLRTDLENSGREEENYGRLS